MKRLLLAGLLLLLTTVASAMPTEEVLHKVTQQVVRLQVALANGNDATGSGVVIAPDRIVTNCHVVANADSINVFVGDTAYAVTSITPDWHHDICLVSVKGLKAPTAKIGKSKHLKHQQPVFAIGYPKRATKPVSSYGHVKGLLPMDDSVIVRASSTFKRGESGGGLFDDDGNLVGVITLKSPGSNPYYYNMPVEWVQALLDQPEQGVRVKAAPTFWAAKVDQRPFFMRVVKPYLNKDWTSLMAVATEWANQEPENGEALFYLAAAEFAKHDMVKAEAHMTAVVDMHARHSDAIYYLGLMAEENGRHDEALQQLALLTELDSEAASKLKSKIYQ